jgi:ABC-type transport system substrate-binding protein
MKVKKGLVIAIVICMVMIALSGCGGSSGGGSASTGESNAPAGEENATAGEGETLVIGAMADFQQGSDTEGHTLVFETLTKLSAEMSVEPNLIESWETNDEMSEYTLKVREGVTFSDGTPLSAEIVKYSIEAWAPYRDGSYMYDLDAIEAVDDLTLKVTFKGSSGNLMAQLARIYASLPDSIDDTGNVVNWIGTGPFVLDDYKLDQSATLSVNPAYWNTDKKPSISGVEWVVIPDENARSMALMNGQVDVVGVSEHHCSLSYATVADYISDDKFIVDTDPDSGLNATYVYNYTNGPMSDIELRKAVTFAIDRDTLVKNVIFDIGEATGDFMSRKYDYAPEKEEAYAYDPNAAKSTLSAGGYKDSDGDGIVEKDGSPVKLRLIVSSDETSRTTAVFVQECLRVVGIDSEIEALDDAARGAKASAGEFDISYTHPWLSTPQTYMPWRGMNSDYDDFGTCFGINDKFEGYTKEIVSAPDSDTVRKVFDSVWADIYPFYPGTGLHSEPRAFIHTAQTSGYIFDPSANVIDLSEVQINRS